MSEMVERNVAALLLYNEKGEVLLQHRTAEASRFPNFWGFFGGGIENGEDPKDAMIRELREELEYESKNHEYFSSTDISSGTRKGILHLFIEQIDTTQKIVQHEGQGMAWFDPLQLEGVPVIPHDKPIIESVGKAFERRRVFEA